MLTSKTLISNSECGAKVAVGKSALQFFMVFFSVKGQFSLPF